VAAPPDTTFTHNRVEWIASWRLDEERGKYILGIRPAAAGTPMSSRTARLALEAFKRRPDFAWPEPPRDVRAVIADWMIANGYPTGHGDTADDLLRELVAGERERCATIASGHALSRTASPEWRQAAQSIRNEIRGQPCPAPAYP
jgi:hypothetical protein